MTEEEITGNKLIAEFMQMSINLDNKIFIWNERRCVDMLYHSSYDWLMPVVEKIEKGLSEEFRVVILEEDCTIWQKTTNQSLMIEFTEVTAAVCCVSKIEATWLTVVEFIKWYNNLKQ